MTSEHDGLSVTPDLRGRADVHQYLSLFSDRLIITAGTMGFPAPSAGEGPLAKGLKVVVILSGRERVDLEGHPTFEIKGPQACVILNDHDSNKVQWVASDVPLRFVLVQMAPSLAQDELGIDLSAVLKQSGDSQRPLLHVSTDTAVLGKRHEAGACGLSSAGQRAGKSAVIVRTGTRSRPQHVEADARLPLRHSWPADRIIVMKNGALNVAGPPETAITPDMLASVYGVAARVQRCERGFLQVMVDERSS